jgi:hypothetical protein
MSTKTCLTCQEPLRGRSDKKFCDDACRSMHHQQKSQEELGQLRQINALLKRNRQILARFWEELRSKPQSESLSRFALIQQGFVFDFHTHRSRDQQGREIHYCYDMGLVEEDTGRFGIRMF